MKRIGEVIAEHKRPRIMPRENRKIGVVEGLIRKATKGRNPEYATHIDGLSVRMEQGSLPAEASLETGLIVDEGRLALRALFNLGKRTIATKARLNKAAEAYAENRNLISILSQETGFRGLVIRGLGKISAYPSVELRDWNLEEVERASGEFAESVVNPKGVTFHVPLLAASGKTADELTTEVLASISGVVNTELVETAHYGDVYENLLGGMIAEGKISLDDDVATAKTTWKVEVEPLQP